MATPMKDWKTEWEQLATEARMLAKRANQRMVRIERYSQREGMSGITEFAYKKAQQYIRGSLGVGPSGKGRFKENQKLYDVDTGSGALSGQALYKANVQILRHRIKAMQEFLGSESSVMGNKNFGIARIYDKRTNTINEKFLSKYGLELSENDLKRFFESKKQAKLAQIVGSDQMFAVASVMKKYNLKSNKRELERFLKNNVELDDRDAVKSQVGESYSDYLDRVRDYIDFTGDEVLDDMVIKALQSGINSNNIFI